MARSNEEVIKILFEIYKDEFGSKKNQRYLIDKGDLRTLFGFSRLEQSRLDSLSEDAYEEDMLIIDLGQISIGNMVAIIKTNTVERWRSVPKKIVQKYIGTRVRKHQNLDEDDDDED